MCDVMNRNGQRVYCPLSAAADFSQQRVKREWFGGHGICSYHRISQHLGWLLTTITGTCAVAGAALSSANTEKPDCSGSTRLSSTALGVRAGRAAARKSHLTPPSPDSRLAPADRTSPVVSRDRSPRPARSLARMDAACPVPHVAHTTDSIETCSMSIVTNAGSGTVVPSGSRPTARRGVGKLIPPKTWCSSV